MQISKSCKSIFHPHRPLSKYGILYTKNADNSSAVSTCQKNSSIVSTSVFPDYSFIVKAAKKGFWGTCISSQIPQNPLISATFGALIPIFLTSILPSPHGTRGQKVRHLPGGLSDLIHRCFCPLDRRWEHI